MTTSFESPENIGQVIQAQAYNYGGFTLRNDFLPEVFDAIYRLSPFWASLTKKAAEADNVREIIRSGLPVSGFSSKTDLSTATPKSSVNLNDGSAITGDNSRNLLNDPGQEVKCITGQLSWTNYSQSLSNQQGQPFGDQVAIDTDDMMTSMAKNLEKALYSGDASTNPLEFNGIQAQMATNTASHQFQYTHDLTAVTPESLSIVIPRTVARIIASRDFERDVTEIHTSAAGLSLLQEEWAKARLNLSETEYVPGVTVTGIMGANGRLIPIVVSRYLDDDATPADGDLINYLFLDKNMIEWRGVVPLGGSGFNPQIFDLVNAQHLTERRLGLCYGTLFARNRGQGISRLQVKAPNGKAWSYVG
jgi:hypothetical protein